VGAAMSCLRYTPRLRREGLAHAAAAAVKSAVHGLLSIAQLPMHSAVRCSRFSRESSCFHSREIGNEKVRESGAPGKREPGNEFSNHFFLACVQASSIFFYSAGPAWAPQSWAVFRCILAIIYYLRGHLASGEGIVTLSVTLSRSVCVCVHTKVVRCMQCSKVTFVTCYLHVLYFRLKGSQHKTNYSSKSK